MSCKQLGGVQVTGKRSGGGAHGGRGVNAYQGGHGNTNAMLKSMWAVPGTP